jgi:hypothetical protein
MFGKNISRLFFKLQPFVQKKRIITLLFKKFANFLVVGYSTTTPGANPTIFEFTATTPAL